MQKMETVQVQKKESNSLPKIFGAVLPDTEDSKSGKDLKKSTSDVTVTQRKADDNTHIMKVQKAEIIPDIDKEIPSGGRANNNTYCVIVANENYSDVPNVEFANRDGEIFKMYCQKTLGIPEKHIKTFYGTTQNAVYTQIWIAVCDYLLLIIAKKRYGLVPSLHSISNSIGQVLFNRADIRDLYNQPTAPVVVPETGSVGQLTLW